MPVFQSELIGTLLLVLLGDGVVANVVLERSKGKDSGWIVITAGWGMAVAVAIYAVGRFSGAHINPAVTFGLLAMGKLSAGKAASYVGGQMVGAFLGAVLVWLAYHPHFALTEDADAKLAVFCTAPEVRSTASNLFTEVLGTAVLVVGFNGMLSNELAPGFDALLVGLLVFSIGLSLGGPTGYAINPARDLGPRLAHAVLPVAGKRDPDWSYAWIPVLGPLVGGVIGTYLFLTLWPQAL